MALSNGTSPFYFGVKLSYIRFYIAYRKNTLVHYDSVMTYILRHQGGLVRYSSPMDSLW